VKGVTRKLLGTALGGAALLIAAMSTPALAQRFSDGYNFLKAVKDREGQEVTDTLNEPGSTIVNTRDITTGETALHIVAKRRDTAWIRFLTQRGGNPNIRDKKGVAPIQIAVRLGHVDGVEALIKAGANVDVADSTGETPLIAAVHARNIQLIEILLDKGANPDQTDNSGRTARDYADFMKSNGAIMNEFEKADKAREEKGNNSSYGPSF